MEDGRQRSSILYSQFSVLLLHPVNIFAKLGLKAFDVKTEHAVHAELAQLARIAGAQRVFLIGREIVFAHYSFKVFQRSLINRLVHFQIEE
jgi:hypothetical protein